MKERLKPVCKSCGSDDVTCDATARWDEDTQNWELSGLFDSKTCGACGYEKDYCNWEVLPEPEEDSQPVRDRLRELLAANSRIVLKGRELKRMLERARDQFKFYAKEHRAKIDRIKADDPFDQQGAGALIQQTIKKAETNEGFAAEIDMTLDSYHSVESADAVTSQG